MNSIGFNNFRCFASFPEMDLGDITLLVGGNNSGKSTLVKQSLWIGTADIKDLYVTKGNDMVPFLSTLAELLKKGC